MPGDVLVELVSKSVPGDVLVEPASILVLGVVSVSEYELLEIKSILLSLLILSSTTEVCN